uniref:Ubiquitin-like domain-containing protein n=1 Tax=Opuntia streptacantha TaxID=393608 RepID=A0A7C9AFX6_OPUST
MGTGAGEVSRHDDVVDSGATIEIKIKTMDSQTYSLRVDKQMSVPALKEQIASVTGVVTEHQRLICRGKVLKDDQLLSAYHVEDGHTLHLVVREPTSSSSQSLPADPGFDRPSNGNHGQFYQVAPGIVVETFNMPGQGDRVLPDISRIISAVLGSIGVTNPGNGTEGTGIRDHGDRPSATPAMSGTTYSPQTQPEQSADRSQTDGSRLHNAIGIPTAVSFGSIQAPVIPDALTTLSQYLSQMRQEFINSGRISENNNGSSASDGNGYEYVSSAQSESSREGLPTPASLAELLSTTRQMLNQQAEECLLQLARQLENQANMTDAVARAAAQSGSVRNGVLLQNLGAYFLELGRTVSTVRLGRSPSEAVVNAGPAVFISPSGPNPLMVQPLPYQAGASFGTPVSGTLQSGPGIMNGLGSGFSTSLSGTSHSGSGLVNNLGSGFIPRRIDIQIRRGPSTHQTEPAGSQQSSGQRPSSTNSAGETQPSSGTSDASSLNTGSAVRILPFRTMMAALPDLNRLPSESSGGSMGTYYPVLGRFPNVASVNLSGRTRNHVSSNSNPESAAHEQNAEDPAGNGQPPASSGQTEPVVSRTIDINILSTGGIQNDQNPDGQMPPGVLQLLRGLFPGSEFQVESVNSQGATVGSVPEQGRSSSPTAEEAEPGPTEEGIFLSRLLQQIMPLISQDGGAEQSVESAGEAEISQQNDFASSSIEVEDSGVGTSRRHDEPDPGPSPKRRKME